jgi:hypothetical protein
MCVSALVLETRLDEFFNCPPMRESLEILVAFSSLGDLGERDTHSSYFTPYYTMDPMWENARSMRWERAVECVNRTCYQCIDRGWEQYLYKTDWLKVMHVNLRMFIIRKC